MCNVNRDVLFIYFQPLLLRCFLFSLFFSSTTKVSCSLGNDSLPCFSLFFPFYRAALAFLAALATIRCCCCCFLFLATLLAFLAAFVTEQSRHRRHPVAVTPLPLLPLFPPLELGSGVPGLAKSSFAVRRLRRRRRPRRCRERQPFLLFFSSSGRSIGRRWRRFAPRPPPIAVVL